jgi:hypothetical protein
MNGVVEVLIIHELIFIVQQNVSEVRMQREQREQWGEKMLSTIF